MSEVSFYIDRIFLYWGNLWSLTPSEELYEILNCYQSVSDSWKENWDSLLFIPSSSTIASLTRFFFHLIQWAMQQNIYYTAPWIYIDTSIQWWCSFEASHFLKRCCIVTWNNEHNMKKNVHWLLVYVEEKISLRWKFIFHGKLFSNFERHLTLVRFHHQRHYMNFTLFHFTPLNLSLSRAFGCRFNFMGINEWKCCIKWSEGVDGKPDALKWNFMVLLLLVLLLWIKLLTNSS